MIFLILVLELGMITVMNHDMNDICAICHMTNQKRIHFPISTSVTYCAFEMIHCDVWGPFSIKSYNGYKCFLTIVDDYSRCT